VNEQAPGGGFEASQTLCRGELDEAASHYRRAIALDPEYVPAHRNLAALSEQSSPDAEIAAMEALLAGPPVTQQQATELSFGLCKAYADTGDHERSFVHLERGNRLVRQSLDYRAVMGRWKHHREHLGPLLDALGPLAAAP